LNVTLVTPRAPDAIADALHEAITPRRMSRREFLHGTAAGAIGAVAVLGSSSPEFVIVDGWVLALGDLVSALRSPGP